MRKAVVLNRLSRTRGPLRLAAQYVAAATHGVNQWLVGAAVNRLAQAADVHVDEIALRIKMQVPDALEQHGAGYHLAGAAHEVLEQLQLPCREVELTARARHPARQQVEFQVLHLQARGVRGGRVAPQQRLDARQEL